MYMHGIRHEWAMVSFLSVPPVLLVCYLCCNYDKADRLLGLFLAEWLVVLTSWRLLCPRMGYRSVAFASMPFLLSFCVAAVITRESEAVHGAKWQWSDDYLYLIKAGEVVDALRGSGSLSEAWSTLTPVRLAGAWSLAGWPFVVGLLSSLVSTDSSLEAIHAIALSVNATSLALIPAIIFNLLGENAEKFPGMAMLSCLLLMPDPVVYAAMSRKESALQLASMLTFAFCFKLYKYVRIQWYVLGMLGFAGLATMRPVSILLYGAVVFWSVSQRLRLGYKSMTVAAIAMLTIFAPLIFKVQIRENAIVDYINYASVVGMEGTSASIYAIPLVGPILYAAVSPVPPLPWKLFGSAQIVTVVIRGGGSIAWLCAAIYVIRSTFKRSKLLSNGLYVSSAIMFLGYFISYVLILSDPRYKQPTNYYLSIMLFISWCDVRTRQCICHHNVDSMIECPAGQNVLSLVKNRRGRVRG